MPQTGSDSNNYRYLAETAENLRNANYAVSPVEYESNRGLGDTNTKSDPIIPRIEPLDWMSPLESLKTPQEKEQEVKIINPNLVNKIRSESRSSLFSRMQGKAALSLDIKAASPTRDNLLSVKDVDVNEQYDQLNDGTLIPKFESFMPGVNNEDRLARQQSGFQKFHRGLSKFGLKTLLYGVGGAVAPIYGLGEAIRKGSLNAILDNDFSRFLDDVDTRMNHNFAHYYSNEEKEMGLLRSMATGNFWFNDVLGGMAFTAGAIVSEGIWAFATGGASLGSTAARMAFRSAALRGALLGSRSAMSGVKSVLGGYLRGMKAAKGIAGAANTARFALTSSAWESSVEALQNKKENEANYIEAYKASHEGKLPTISEMQEFEEANKNASNAVFAANMAIVGASNIVMFGQYLGVGNKLVSSVGNALDKTVGLGVTRKGANIVRTPFKGWQRKLGRTLSALEKPFTEGIWEEGLQGVSSSAAEEYMKSRFDPAATEQNLTFLQSVKEGFVKTYDVTSPNFKEVGIGMIIGTLMGGVRRRPGTRLGISYDFKSLVGGEYQAKSERLDKLIKAHTESVNSLNTASINTLNRTVSLNGMMSSTMSSLDQDIVNADPLADDNEISKIAYHKFQIEEQLGMLDDSAESFNKMVDDISIENIKKENLLSEEEAENYKSQLKANYAEKLDNYKEASKFSDLILGDTRMEGYKDVVTQNIYDGVVAGKNMDRLALRISELTKRPELNDALSAYTKLTSESQKLVSELATLEDDIRRIDQEAERIATTIRKDGESTQESLGSDITERENKVRRMEEIQDTLASMQTQSFDTNVFEDLRGLTSTGQAIPVAQLVEAHRQLSAFDDYLASETKDDDITKDLVRTLVDSYRDNLVAYRNMNNFLKQARDPRFLAQEDARALRPVMKALFDNIDEVDIEQNPDFISEGRVFDPQKNEVLFANDAAIKKTYDEGKISKQEMFTFMALNHAIDKWQQKTNTSTANETISDEEYDQAINQNNPSDEVLNRIGRKVDVNSDSLTPREKEIYNKHQAEIDNRWDNSPRSVLQALRDRINRLFGINKPNLLDKNKAVIQEVLNRRGLSQDEKDIFDSNLKEYSSLSKKLLDGETFTPEEQIQYNDLAAYFNTMGLKPLVDQNIALELIKQISVNPVFNDLESLLSETVSETEPADNFDSAQNPYTVVCRLGENGFILSNINIERFVNLLSPFGAIQKNGKNYIILFDNGSQAVLKADDIRGRILIDEESAALINSNTDLVIQPIGNIEPSKWYNVYKRTGDTYTPLLSESSYGGQGNKSYINQEALEKAKKGDEVYTEVDLSDDYNITLLSALEKAISDYNNALNTATPEELNVLKQHIDSAFNSLISNIVIKLYNKNLEFISVLKSGESYNSDTMLNIRSSFANEILSIETTDKGRKIVLYPNGNGNFRLSKVYKISQKLPGRPVFNLRQGDDGIVVEDKRISKEASKKIKDVGYIEDGKLLLKKGVKGVNLFPFASNLLRSTKGSGERVPVVVVEHGGVKYAYPVSLVQKSAANEAATNLVSAIDNVLFNAQNGLENSLEDINNINVQVLRMGLGQASIIPIANVTEQDVIAALQALKARAEAISDFIDPVYWMSDGRTVGEIAREDVLINIDIDDKPFIAPKIRLALEGVKVKAPKVIRLETVEETPPPAAPTVPAQEETVEIPKEVTPSVVEEETPAAPETVPVEEDTTPAEPAISSSGDATTVIVEDDVVAEVPQEPITPLTPSEEIAQRVAKRYDVNNADVIEYEPVKLDSDYVNAEGRVDKLDKKLADIIKENMGKHVKEIIHILNDNGYIYEENTGWIYKKHKSKSSIIGMYNVLTGDALSVEAKHAEFIRKAISDYRYFQFVVKPYVDIVVEAGANNIKLLDDIPGTKLLSEQYKDALFQMNQKSSHLNGPMSEWWKSERSKEIFRQATDLLSTIRNPNKFKSIQNRVAEAIMQNTNRKSDMIVVDVNKFLEQKKAQNKPC